MSRVLNTSGWKVVKMCAGIDYEFLPFSIVNMYDEYIADHILTTGKENGLISLEPDNAEKLKFANDKIGFFRAKTLEGLKNLREKCNKIHLYELQAEKDVKLSDKATSGDKAGVNAKKFELSLKQVDDWIKEVESDKWSPDKYLKNEIKDNHESWDYTTKSKASAG